MSPKRKKELQTEIETLKEIAGIETKNSDFFCSKCGDLGYLVVEVENDTEQAALCDCVKKRMRHDLFSRCGIPREFFGVTIDSAWNINQDAYGNDLGKDKIRKRNIGDFMKKYIKAIPAFQADLKLSIKRPNKPSLKINSLLLIGGNKSGKSLLASLAVQETLQNGLSAMMYDWIHLCTVLSQYEFKEEHDLIAKEFSEMDFIVIDGVCNYPINSPCFIIQLDRICRERIRSGKPIIITTDNTYKDIKAANNWHSLIEYCFPIFLPTSGADNKLYKEDTI
jgi:DNA replication protein DnaC